jgi:Icc-related predicted phosphoesterase
MRLVIISDTHNQHEDLGVLHGDVLIHCGDSGMGFERSVGEVDRLDEWFGRQDFKQILCIGGNHDFQLQERVGNREPVLRNAVYLQDEGISFGGVHFYGAPWTPELAGWAFYLPPELMRAKWASIPACTDVLITHTPPFGVLDRNSQAKACGCPDLRQRTAELRPRIHCFGHIHASGGQVELKGTTYVNASMVSSRYRIIHRPYEFDL